MNYALLPCGNEILCPANESNMGSSHPKRFLQHLLIGSYQLIVWRMLGRVMKGKALLVPSSNMNVSQEVEHDHAQCL